ncbi:phage repressor protein CI [Vibrio olivae]|uniref:Phage repressor protein CI n=1 Tax=Vibrio olivae TaxID=1243002 RepID=A0ABV5HN67_9VIBR
MSRIPAKVPPFEYIKGREFTDKLREVTNCEQYNQLADYFGIPRSTIITWHSHDRTPFELIVREHLNSGASVKYLALGEGEPFSGSSSNENLATYELEDGSLKKSGSMSLDLATLERFGLKPTNTQVIENDAGIYYINKDSVDPISGDYLIDVDGRLSINYLQRLPGKKLAIAFNTSTIEVSEEDIKVLGRVAAEMKKK